jgi:hypothetical protein
MTILSRTQAQTAQLGQILKTAAGRQKLATALGPSLRRRRDYMSIARKALMVETLPDGALPIYDKEFDETGRSFVQAFVVGEQGGDVVNVANPIRVTVPTFEIVSNPMIPITQIKERRFDIVSRALNLAKAEVGAAEDNYVFDMFLHIDSAATTATAVTGYTDYVYNKSLAYSVVSSGGGPYGISVSPFADAFGMVQRHDLSVAYIFMNPRDYVDILKWTDSNIDRETQRHLLKTGIMGYLWGATILQSRKVAYGDIWIMADAEFLGVIPERVPLTVLSADRPDLRQIGFSVFEILGFLIFNPSGLERIVITRS